jgi:putative CocE/NonD family hydrolase
MVVVLAIVGAMAPAAMAAKPVDYIALSPKLSKPEFTEIARTDTRVDTFDGESLYVEVVRPDPAKYGNGPWPVIMEASPYHGTLADRSGTRMFPDPTDADGNKLGLTGYFAPRGYAVVMVDLRGTGRSTGCLEHLGPNDAEDLKMIIEWAAGQEWSNGRVGLTGHSYVGSTPSAAAAQNPDGLATIAPSAGLAGFYDHQFNKGVPWLLQWAGPMFSYEGLAMDRDLPPGATDPVSGAPTGDNFENAPNPQFGCGWQNSALTSGSGQVTGQYNDWHAARDWREGAAAADIPIFMIHGVNDNAARIPASEWFFDNRFRRPGDKVWIGQWDHGSTNGRCGGQDGKQELHPTCRFAQFQYALHAWFDKHLKQRNVSTGPPVEAFLNGPEPVDVTEVLNPETVGGRVYAAGGWKRPAATLSLFPDAATPGPDGSDGMLSFEPPAEEGSASFGTVAEAVAASVGRGRVTFTSEPVAKDRLFLGLPQLRLNASQSTGQIQHLTATLFREQVITNEEGEEEVLREPMNFCAIQSQLREGIDTVTPVVPGEEMALDLQCFTMAHWIPAGQRLSLEISTGTPHHASFGDSDQQITVFTGPESTGYTLPAVPRFRLADDVPLWESYPPPVPLGPAQPGIEGDVFVPLPGPNPTGGGVIVEPLTAASFEFDSEEEYDNAALEALATPSSPPADIDLYLQRETEDGGWEDVSAGTSSSTEQEVLKAGRLEAGRYRIVVNNWIGGPQDVHLELTFFNQEGEPGEGTAGSGTAGTAHLATGESYGLPQP